MSRIYSPSQTAAWGNCPVYRRLSYIEKWTSRRLGKRDLAAVLGSGVSAGLGAYYNIRKEGSPGSLAEVQKTCASIAVTIAKDRLAALEARGASVADFDRAQRDALPDRVFRAVAKTLEWDYDGRVIPPSWTILDVERTLINHGYARPDLAVYDGLGPAIVDWKTKLTLDNRYRQKEIDRYRKNGQLIHYAWGYGEEALSGTPIHRYYIGLIVLEPRFSVELIPYGITDEDLRKWLQSARRKWAQMAAEDTGRPLIVGVPTGDPADPLDFVELPAEPWMADKHADEFGNCEFYAACFDYQWDPVLMDRDYIRKEDKQ